MAKQIDLIKNVDYGDYQVIASIFNARHGRKDKKTIHVSYVNKLLKGARKASPNSTASEVLTIAAHYLKTKQRCKEELIAA